MLTRSNDHSFEQATSSDAPLLELRDVSAGYGRIEVLHNVDLAVTSGRLVAVLGPNGAGKTTALGVMSGLMKPWSGCRHVAGRHVNDADAFQLARVGVCHIREGRSVFPNLSVADNLVVASSSGSTTSRLEEVAYTYFPRLGARRKQLAGTLSGGERQMLALARGLGVDPAALIIDELSMGLAPLIVANLYEAVAAIAESGIGVLVVEQFASIALRFAEHAVVMSHGRIAFSGPSADAGEAIESAYLGRPT